jgi:lysophospholipase L1-like esterase
MHKVSVKMQLIRMITRKNIVISGILLCLIFAQASLYSCPANYLQGDSLRYKSNPNYDYEVNLYKIYKKKSAAVVMLGNSITHGVNWNELTGRDDIVERGIPADVLDGFFARLQYVFDLHPKVCFIMGGINDIYNASPVEDVFKSYIKVVEALRMKDIKVVIQSTLYVAKRYNYSADKNLQVEKLNKMLSEYAKNNGIEFVDLNAKMSADKFLKNELTHDGLHLNANGYKIWGQEFERVIKKYVY